MNKENRKELSPNFKKELVLREHLAIERTRMSNQRTLLSFLRSGLYFLVAGSTLGQVMDTAFWRYLGLPFIFIGVIMMILGVIVYLTGTRALARSRKQIGEVKDDFIESVIR